MNKIIVASVLLVSLVGAVRAELDPVKMQSCLEEYVKSIDQVQVPEEIEEIDRFVHSHDPSGSLRTEDILAENKIDISEFVKDKAELERRQILASDLFWNSVKTLVYNDCAEDIDFREELYRIREDNTDKDHAKIVKPIDLMSLCTEILKAGDN